jgi:hypothetical protein
MGASRNFECDATGKPCADPRCKKNFCVLDYQEPTHRPPSNEPFRRDVIQSEAEKVARDWIRWGRLLRIPTKAQLEKAAQHPAIIAEAKRRLAAKRAFQSGLFSN